MASPSVVFLVSLGFWIIGGAFSSAIPPPPPPPPPDTDVSGFSAEQWAKLPSVFGEMLRKANDKNMDLPPQYVVALLLSDTEFDDFDNQAENLFSNRFGVYPNKELSKDKESHCISGTDKCFKRTIHGEEILLYGDLNRFLKSYYKQHKEGETPRLLVYSTYIPCDRTYLRNPDKRTDCARQLWYDLKARDQSNEKKKQYKLFVAFTSIYYSIGEDYLQYTDIAQAFSLLQRQGNGKLCASFFLKTKNGYHTKDIRTIGKNIGQEPSAFVLNHCLGDSGKKNYDMQRVHIAKYKSQGSTIFTQTLLMDCLGMVIGRCPCLDNNGDFRKNNKPPLENIINDVMKQCVAEENASCGNRLPNIRGAMDDEKGLRGCLAKCIYIKIATVITTVAECSFCRNAKEASKAKIWPQLLQWCLTESLLTQVVGCPNNNAPGWSTCTNGINTGYNLLN